jgi:1-acyl-sn-glycerol-3-phosphate acyltransferase
MSGPVTRPVVRLLARAVKRVLTRTTVTMADSSHSLASLPRKGPLLVVFNHLGHLDAAILIPTLPYSVDAVALSDLLRVPVTGQIMRLYGVIVVHRDVFDRTVLERALDCLRGGGVLILAPEARMSVTGALEKARGGAGYLALKSGAPILPVALTGTENANVYGAWKSRRRPRITITIGEVFHLPDLPLDGQSRKQSIDQASTIIMSHLAALLPPQYRGVYADAVERGSNTE